MALCPCQTTTRKPQTPRNVEYTQHHIGLRGRSTARKSMGDRIEAGLSSLPLGPFHSIFIIPFLSTDVCPLNPAGDMREREES